MLTVAFVLTSTFTEFWTSFLKPVASTVIEYTPGVRPVTAYVPALLVGRVILLACRLIRDGYGGAGNNRAAGIGYRAGNAGVGLRIKNLCG